jgi:hypothetical protein
VGVWKSKSEDKEEDDVAICYLPSFVPFIGFVYKVAGSQSLIADLRLINTSSCKHTPALYFSIQLLSYSENDHEVQSRPVLVN